MSEEEGATTPEFGIPCFFLPLRIEIKGKSGNYF
jgi:hypothetical protein